MRGARERGADIDRDTKRDRPKQTEKILRQIYTDIKNYIRNTCLRELQQQLSQLRIRDIAQTRDRIFAHGRVRVARIQQFKRLVRVQRRPRLQEPMGLGLLLLVAPVDALREWVRVEGWVRGEEGGRKREREINRLRDRDG